MVTAGCRAAADPLASANPKNGMSKATVRRGLMQGDSRQWGLVAQRWGRSGFRSSVPNHPPAAEPGYGPSLPYADGTLPARGMSIRRSGPASMTMIVRAWKRCARSSCGHGHSLNSFRRSATHNPAVTLAGACFSAWLRDGMEIRHAQTVHRGAGDAPASSFRDALLRRVRTRRTPRRDTGAASAAADGAADTADTAHGVRRALRRRSG